MAYGSRDKRAAAALSSMESRRFIDGVTEACASRRFQDDLSVSAALAREGLKAGAPAFSVEIGDKIGKQLREIYDSVLREPLPDRFSELLDGLERAHD